MSNWHDLGTVESFSAPLTPVTVGKKRYAVTRRESASASSPGVCNHAGGPLGEGRLDGEYVVCPWHGWKYHAATGKGEPGFEEDAVPSFPVRVEGGRLLVDLDSGDAAHAGAPRAAPAGAPVERAPGPIRVVGISTTNMDLGEPALLDVRRPARACAGATPGRALGAETRTIRLAELKFRHCEGYYSKSARACTWPCSITQMDPADQMDRVYEAFVHWARRVPRRHADPLGQASSLYYKMVERMNCIQNQDTIANRRAAAEQGGRVHHHRRAGQRAGRRGADADVLRRDRLPVPAVPVHRPQPRLVGRGHGEQRATTSGRARSSARAPSRCWPRGPSRPPRRSSPRRPRRAESHGVAGRRTRFLSTTGSPGRGPRE